MSSQRSNLRARLGAAKRWQHDPDEIEALQTELRLVNVETAIAHYLDDQPLLTAEESDRLCAVVRTYAEPVGGLLAMVQDAQASVGPLAGRLKAKVARGEQLDLIELLNEPEGTATG